jgi:hypothetical protein
MPTRFKVGDFFSVPLSDGSTALGQILSIEPDAMGAVACAFFARRNQSEWDADLLRLVDPSSLVSLLLVLPREINRRTWKVVGNSTPVDGWEDMMEIHQRRQDRFIGAKVLDGGAVAMFLNAFHGLTPWDGAYRPDLFDEYLVHQMAKPARELLRWK